MYKSEPQIYVRIFSNDSISFSKLCNAAPEHDDEADLNVTHFEESDFYALGTNGNTFAQ